MQVLNEINNIHSAHFLSIIIPVLEPDVELTRCIYCIKAAFIDAQMPEIIIVTPQRFVEKTKDLFPQVVVCAETKKGIYGAMNDGARISQGDYLYFLGKDDIVLPALSSAIVFLKRERPLALCSDVYWGSRGLYRGAPSRMRILIKNLCHQGIIYSREAFDRHGPYLRQMRVQADHFLNIKILWDKQSKSRVQYFSEPLAWYSGDGFSTINRDPVFWRLYPNIIHRFVGTWAACILVTYRKLRSLKSFFN